MANPSLCYEILLYINSFYFGLFALCELSTLILKSVLITEKYRYDHINTSIDPLKLGKDYGVLIGLIIIEGLRLVLGRRGSLSERDIPVILSAILTVPSMSGVSYLLFGQVVVLRIEIVWCILLLAGQLVECVCAIMCIVNMCRGPSYD